MSRTFLVVVVTVFVCSSLTHAQADCTGVKPYAYYSTTLQAELYAEPGQADGFPYESCGGDYSLPVYDAATVPESCYHLPATVITCPFASFKATTVTLEAALMTDSRQDPFTADLQIRTNISVSGQDHINAPEISTDQAGSAALKGLGFNATIDQGIALETVDGRKYTGLLFLRTSVDTTPQ